MLANLGSGPQSVAIPGPQTTGNNVRWQIWFPVVTNTFWSTLSGFTLANLVRRGALQSPAQPMFSTLFPHNLMQMKLIVMDRVSSEPKPPAHRTWHSIRYAAACKGPPRSRGRFPWLENLTQTKRIVADRIISELMADEAGRGEEKNKYL